MDDKMIDVAIIGAGPAGLSAAINVVSRNKTAVVFGRKKETSWLFKAENINNHLGMPNMTGEDMLNSFIDHAKGLNIEIKDGRVFQILPFGDKFGINFDNDFFEAKTIVISTGVSKGKYLKGESEYLGKGVSYCATCDGMLYKNKDVVIVGEIEEGEEDANFLSEICSKVTYIPLYKNVGHINDNIEVVSGKPEEVIGEEFVTGVKVNDNIIPCECVFFIKASTPTDSLVTGLEIENNHIVVNKNMETNINGIYACGDCTGTPFQVSNAIGDGLVAGQQAVKYITAMKKQEL